MQEYKGYMVREGTMDRYIIDELASYRHLKLEPDDIVLDVGANIGSFAKYASTKAERVFAIEPHPENYELLLTNAPNCACIHGAVVHSTIDGFTTLYVNGGINKGLHSTVPTRGRTEIAVPAVTWTNLLEIYRPSKIKIDCEGAEYYFLFPKLLPEWVKGVIIEYNLTRRGEQQQAQIMHEDFYAWKCVKQPRFGTKAWATMACYER